MALVMPTSVPVARSGCMTSAHRTTSDRSWFAAGYDDEMPKLVDVVKRPPVVSQASNHTIVDVEARCAYHSGPYPASSARYDASGHRTRRESTAVSALEARMKAHSARGPTQMELNYAWFHGDARSSGGNVTRITMPCVVAVTYRPRPPRTGIDRKKRKEDHRVRGVVLPRLPACCVQSKGGQMWMKRKGTSTVVAASRVEYAARSALK